MYNKINKKRYIYVCVENSMETTKATHHYNLLTVGSDEEQKGTQ